MPIVDSLMLEFDHEMATTRRLLDRVPEARFAWKPHDKSMSLAELSGHLANIPYWCTATLSGPFIDLDVLGPPPKPPATRDAMLKTFDEKVATARARLATTTD